MYDNNKVMIKTRLRENKIGEEIYNRINKDIDKNDVVSRQIFLKTLTEEEKKLYEKYRNMINKRNSLANDPSKREKQDKDAKEGMRKLRDKRPKEQMKEQRKPYDEKYIEKKKTSAFKEEAENIVKDILDDIIDKAPNMKIVNGELKKKRGRKIK